MGSKLFKIFSAGQMGALTAGLAGAGLDLGNFESQDEEEDLGEGEEE